jgi:hypothetical protein
MEYVTDRQTDWTITYSSLYAKTSTDNVGHVQEIERHSVTNISIVAGSVKHIRVRIT